MKTLAVFLSLVGVFCGQISADETAIAVEPAARRGLALVTHAATNWQGTTECFSCHHQTLPMLAATEASRAGF
jgi:N-acyl-D-amino-acid deacylase